MSTAKTFEAVISAWSEQVCYEMTTHQGARVSAVGALAGRSPRLRTGAAVRTPQGRWVRQTAQLLSTRRALPGG
jgi:hypothetical protein